MNHSKLIDLWPSLAQFSRETGIHYESVRAYRRSGMIPYWFWTAVFEAAAKRGFHGVTYEALAEGAAEAKAQRWHVTKDGPRSSRKRPVELTGER